MALLLSQLLATFWTTIFPLLVVAAGGYLIKQIVPILNAITLRLGIAVSKENEALVATIATKWVMAAESIFEAQVQSSMAPILDKSNKKLAFALAGITSDLPQMPANEARVHVEAALQDLSLGPATPERTTVTIGARPPIKIEEKTS